MKNRNKNLKFGRKDMPLHTPPEQIWSNIEVKLSSKEHSFKLPIHKPDDSVWNEIEKQLPGKRNYLRVFIKYGIAASFLIAGFFIIKHVDFKSNKTVVSIEKVDKEEVPDYDFDNQKVYDKLAVLCEINFKKCDSEIYKVKEKSLQKIQIAIKETEEMLSRFPNDNQLLAQNNYFKKQESDALRELILLTTKDI
jgi:hypothetical protein